MRRIVSAALTLLMAFSVLLMVGGTASANALAGGGYSSSYSGESVFTNQPAGGTGQFSAIFFNDGKVSWAPGVVGLLVCLADKVTCNVASPNAAYASGWTSTTVYATVTATVAPGQNGFFIYNFVVPAGTAPGTAATFNGDVGLIATGTELRPEGYFQVNTTPSAAPGALTISPTSASLPVGGQQQFTVTGAPAGSTVAFSVTGGCGAITATGLFAATATNSPTQPCSVVATAGGLSATAAITVFGPASALRCSASPATAVTGGNTVVVTGTVIDANGNVVANDSSDMITFTNSSTTLISASSKTPDATVGGNTGRLATNGVATKNFTTNSTGTTGTAVVSLSSPTTSTLTGCSQNITITGPGPAAALANSFGLTTIAADGSSTAILEVDETDAAGNVVVTDGTTSIQVSQQSGAASCTASTLSGTLTTGSAYFLITSTTTPGTCSWASNTVNVTGISAGTATLTTILVGSANKLSVTATGSPKPADGVSTLRITVALQDAVGSPVTTNSQTCTSTTGSYPTCTAVSGPTSPQVSLTATLGNGCVGTNAAGTADQVKFGTGTAVTQGTTGAATTSSKNSGTLSASSILAASSNLARFTLESNFATTCTVTVSGTGVTSTSVNVVFTPQGAFAVGCVFNPQFIVNNGSSTSVATVATTDVKGNLVTSGTFSVTFSRSASTNTGGGTTAATTLLTSSPQTTSSGIAQFTVKSVSSGQSGTDTYLPATTINGVATSTGSTPPTAQTCQIQVNSTGDTTGT